MPDKFLAIKTEYPDGKQRFRIYNQEVQEAFIIMLDFVVKDDHLEVELTDILNSYYDTDVGKKNPLPTGIMNILMKLIKEFSIHLSNGKPIQYKLKDVSYKQLSGDTFHARAWITPYLALKNHGDHYYKRYGFVLDEPSQNMLMDLIDSGLPPCGYFGPCSALNLSATTDNITIPKDLAHTSFNFRTYYDECDEEIISISRV